MGKVNVGDKFKRWTVVELVKTGKDRYWLCRCLCGTERIVCQSGLRRGHSGSCGCLRKEKFTKHGMRKSSEYNSWANMKNRCLNSNNERFHSYGGRGLKVCKRWIDSFEIFFKDMGPKPKGTSIERIDNNKGYYPNNCKWATPMEQANNTRSNKKIWFKGKNITIAQLGRELGKPHATTWRLAQKMKN